MIILLWVVQINIGKKKEKNNSHHCENKKVKDWIFANSPSKYEGNFSIKFDMKDIGYMVDERSNLINLQVFHLKK